MQVRLRDDDIWVGVPPTAAEEAARRKAATVSSPGDGDGDETQGSSSRDSACLRMHNTTLTGFRLISACLAPPCTFGRGRLDERSGGTHRGAAGGTTSGSSLALRLL
eukprot:SAG11_NODE_413_length_9694_cov_2.695675_10_plen_107_part_00